MKTRNTLARFLCAIAVATLPVGAAGAEEPEKPAAPQAATESPPSREAPAAGTLALPSVGTASSPWRLGVAVGYGARSNPLIQSDDVPIIVDLDIAWFGEHFFFDNGDVGLTFLDNDILTASAVARFNSDRVFFSRTDTKFVRLSASGEPLAQPVELSVPDRDYAVEAGFELLADGSWGRVELTAFHDVSGTHGGYEIFIGYGNDWRRQRWYVEPSLGLAYKSQALNDYYWGVRPEEANAALPAYQAGAGVNPQARLLVSYQATRHLALVVVGEYARLNDEAARSPIVADHDVVAYFAGVGYRF